MENLWGFSDNCNHWKSPVSMTNCIHFSYLKYVDKIFFNTVLVTNNLQEFHKINIVDSILDIMKKYDEEN